jgi:DNA modification methylase
MGWRKGKKPKRCSNEVLSTVWCFDTLANGPERPDHPTPKPVELFEIPLRQHTRAGDLCFEPFAGSGTQLMAAERLKRRCRALEISAVYCDVIVRRYIAAFGEGSVSPDIAERYRLPGAHGPVITAPSEVET